MLVAKTKGPAGNAGSDDGHWIINDDGREIIAARSRALQMEIYPKFHNEVGLPIVRIGSREFKCIGDKPPQDHPHIYLNMGDASEISCPYCSTLFRFDPSLGAHEADPADCAYGDMD
jgi:uncharacterized Zn-finger protein